MEATLDCRVKIVVSANHCRNKDVFPDILSLYVPPRARIADLTYGPGHFWTKVPVGKYRLNGSDLVPRGNAVLQADLRCIPYLSKSMDAVVLDPPYISGLPFRDGLTRHERNYRCIAAGLRSHQDVIRLYIAGAAEAHRILRSRGVLILKCQDETCGRTNYFSHVEIMAHLADRWVCEDLFVVTFPGGTRRSSFKVQRHARKNHSYFLVFRKRQRCRRKPAAPRMEMVS